MIRPFFDDENEPDLRKPVGFVSMKLPNIPAVRYNNPGDVSLPILGWSGPGKIVGIKGQRGYAEFPSMQVGFEAFQQRIRAYIAEGRTTLQKIGEVYATDPSWTRSVAEISKISLDLILNPKSATQMTALAAAIIRQETGLTAAELGIRTSQVA